MSSLRLMTQYDRITSSTENIQVFAGLWLTRAVNGDLSMC